MANQSWVSLLPPGQPAWSGAGAALSTAATATISPMPISPTPNASDYNVPVPGGVFYTGMMIRVLARGFLTTTATSTTATVFLASNIGNTGTTYVTLATTPGITTGTTVLTGIQWKLEALIRCTAVAASGTLATQGEMGLQGMTSVPAQMANPFVLTAAAPEAYAIPLPLASGETAATVNTLATQGIALRATLAGANATIQCTQWLLEALN